MIWLGERFSAKRGAGLLMGVFGVAVLVGWSPIVMTEEIVLSIVATLVATCSYGNDVRVGALVGRRVAVAS
jgi:drug/metabolite transporter (DMT)-like permease